MFVERRQRRRALLIFAASWGMVMVNAIALGKGIAAKTPELTAVMPGAGAAARLGAESQRFRGA